MAVRRRDVRLWTASRLLSPVDLPRARAEDRYHPGRPGCSRFGTANLDAGMRAGRTLFPPRRRCRWLRTVFMEIDRSKKSSRADGGAQFCARVAQTASVCSELWNSLDVHGRPECFNATAICNCVVRWRNLTAESVLSLATRASSYPSALQTPEAAQNQAAPPSSQSCGSSSRRGRQAHFFSPVAGIHPDNTAFRGTHFCGSSPTITNLRQHAVPPTRASLSSAKPRK